MRAMEAAKRSADKAGLNAPCAEAKHARLEDDEVAKAPTGVNVIEIDGKSCTHEVSWPPGQEGSKLPPARQDAPPAKVYPFKLDPFQQTAINALETGTLNANVFLACHLVHSVIP